MTAQTKQKTPKEKIVVVVGKKKKALARARVRAGKGSIRINSVPLSQWGSYYERTIVSEPLLLVQDSIRDLDIDVWTEGGGKVGQAAAVRVAIARGIVDFLRNSEVRKALISYDDKILSGDARQREPNKPNRSAPRAVRQKSYR
ncbi:TPA: 30S ribosomal protein S9 [archaeon]|uniref:30S ribosomal protein S9 n=1 Tax=Candidatus Naiadarchaeum limnaeum TaxID=2756139 RepID=A0A832UVM7_9ARCH|nr:30S ribosomal protein S9 [Candidatus Naiadarchaeum limnaeum]